jgi:microcin C transport system substrate-binding protein
LTLLLASAGSYAATPTHGVSVYGPENLKLGPDEPFSYANPDAPKGGHLNLRSFGNFTTLNQFTLKGIPGPLLDLVFESATTRSEMDNEPGTAYANLAKSIEIAPDHLSMTYQLRPEARFSDGHPVTADDFVFSFDLISHPEYSPMYKQYFADIKGIVKLGEHSVRYEFKRRNQELPLITGEIPLLPKHIYGAPGKDFGKDFDSVAVGSGPYVIERYEFGKYITVRRNPQWWGRNLAKNLGRYNFDTITAKVYLDEVSMKEAFKGGDFDVMWVSSSKDWALDYKGPFVKKNYIVRQEIPHKRPQGMQCFAFNLRRELFQSHKTRYALALAFDFPWSNTNLFYGQYRRIRCYFENSPDLTETAPPTGEMKRYLDELRRKHGPLAVPKAALYKPLQAPGDGQSAEQNLLQAEQLLEIRGWKRGPDGIRVKDGRRLTFELLLAQQAWQRIAEPYRQRLRQLGAEMKITVVQVAEYQKRLRAFDYDLIVSVFQHSPSPGNELLSEWGSKAADTEGSRNFTGLHNAAVDEILGKLVQAQSRADLAFQIHALDRILTSGTYVVPQWMQSSDRVLYWNRFGHPKQHCSQGYFETTLRDLWWYDATQAQALQKSMSSGEPMAE